MTLLNYQYNLFISSNHKFACALLFCLFLVLFSNIQAPALCMDKRMEKQVENNVEARVKAAYLVKFTKFIYWDSRAANARSSISPIIISVLGSDPVGGLLDNFSQNQKSGSPIIVNRIGKDLNNLENCNLLFISKQEAARLPTIFKQLEGSNVVTVSDINNFARRGGMIGFVVDEDRVKLEINLDATNRAGLKISAKLLELSKIITKAE